MHNFFFGEGQNVGTEAKNAWMFQKLSSGVVIITIIIIVIIIIIIIIIITNYYATKILNTETDSKCRFCQQFDETIDHIISACPILAKEQYTQDMIEYVPNYTSTYARKQWYNWTKNTGMNMHQNQ